MSYIVNEIIINKEFESFDFEKLHQQLTKRKLAYYCDTNNLEKRIPSISEMKEICDSLRESMCTIGVSESSCLAFKAKKDKKCSKVTLSFDFKRAKMFI